MTAAFESRPTSYGRVSLAVIMRTVEANLAGNIHGGEIVKLADSTAGAVGIRHTGGQVVTAALDEMVFLEPVHVGDIVHTYGQVNWVGRTSLEVGVRIEAQPHSDPATTGVHVASAYFVMVAIGSDGRPREVPQLTLEGADDERRWREAEIRRAHRLAKREEIMQAAGAEACPGSLLATDRPGRSQPGDNRRVVPAVTAVTGDTDEACPSPQSTKGRSCGPSKSALPASDTGVPSPSWR